MFETDILEKEIKKRIQDVLPNLNLDKINFSVGKDNSPEGIYFFYMENKYHYVYTEKGKIRIHKEMESEEEVFWNVLEILLFDVAMDYAIRNRIKGKDFRRGLFRKEIELYSKFGEDLKKRKIEEINEILKENPYCDQ